MSKIYIDFKKPSYTKIFEGVYDETHEFTIIEKYDAVNKHKEHEFRWNDDSEGTPEGDIDSEIMDQFMTGMNPDKELENLRADLQDMVLDYLSSELDVVTNSDLVKEFRTIKEEYDPMVTHENHEIYFINNSIFSISDGIWYISKNDEEKVILEDLT